MPKKAAKKIVKQKASLKQHEEKTISYLSVDDLLYDPQNPRLPHTIINSKNEGEVINWMLKDASILELMDPLA
jgi:hypothetical protein